MPSCSVELEYRPVAPTGLLSYVNHAYIDVTIGGASSIIEGLPQFNPPISPPTLWGNLTSNVFSVSTSGTVPGDPSDRPQGDPIAGGVSGGASICADIQSLLAEASSFPTVKYNPVPGFPFTPIVQYNVGGINSNTYAWLLLTGVG